MCELENLSKTPKQLHATVREARTIRFATSNSRVSLNRFGGEVDDKKLIEETSNTTDKDGVELDSLINAYLLQLDALYETAVRTMIILIKSEKVARAAFKQYLQSLPGYDDENPVVTLDGVSYHKFSKLNKRRRKAAEARRMLAHSFLVSMVSQYDAFFSSAVRILFKLKPEKLRARDRAVTISHIVRYGTLQELLVDVVNDEVDEVLRGSHLEQLHWLGKTFDFALDEKLPLIQAFVEITERRNICVHSDGRISKQYVDKCKKLDQGLISNGNIGDWVPIGPDYLKRAHDVLFEVGLRGMQTAWRKIRPDQKEEQSDMLTDISYDLLTVADYELAKCIGSYALEMRDMPDVQKKIVLINTAIALKFSNDNDKARKLLESIDWSGSELKFRLGVAVLKDEYDEVPALMASIPSDGVGSIPLAEYRSWPLFKEARKHRAFQVAFEEKFGEPIEQTSVHVDLGQEENPEATEGSTRQSNPGVVSKERSEDPSSEAKSYLL